MKKLTREELQHWLDEIKVQHALCSDCDAIHLTDYESQPAIIEARLFVEEGLVKLAIDLAIKLSTVLPLQGSLHLIGFDFPLLQFGFWLEDDEIPRLTLSAALVVKNLTPTYFATWLTEVLAAVDKMMIQANKMDVLMLDDLLDSANDALH